MRLMKNILDIGASHVHLKSVRQLHRHWKTGLLLAGSDKVETSALRLLKQVVKIFLSHSK